MFILKTIISIGEQRIHTTTTCPTSCHGSIIVVSFLPEHPPRPSNLFVHYPNLGIGTFEEEPIVLAMVDDFFLVMFAMAVDPERCFVIGMDQRYDYLIYNPKHRMLQMLPHPHPRVFYPDQVSLLPHGDGHYIVATLVSSVRNPFMCELHSFDSKAGSWESRRLRVDPLLRKFPVGIPKNSSDLLHHTSSNVITLRGKYGIMGWVDLWRDVLLCDVLKPGYPELRTVPLPLPIKQINSNEGHGIILRYPRCCRGIVYVEAKSHLMFVELQFDVPFNDDDDDDETWPPIVKVVHWSVKTFNNHKMTTLWEDWDLDLEVEADDIKIGFGCSPLISELLKCKSSPHSHEHDDGDVAEPTLQDISVFQPGLSIDDEQVVYLLTSGVVGDQKTWVLAIDMENKTLLDVTEFGIETPLFSPILYCRGSRFTTTSQVTGGA